MIYLAAALFFTLALLAALVAIHVTVRLYWPEILLALRGELGFALLLLRLDYFLRPWVGLHLLLPSASHRTYPQYPMVSQIRTLSGTARPAQHHRP